MTVFDPLQPPLIPINITVDPPTTVLTVATSSETNKSLSTFLYFIALYSLEHTRSFAYLRLLNNCFKVSGEEIKEEKTVLKLRGWYILY